MILSQLRREFGVRSLLWWVPIGFVLGVWIFGMCRYTAAEIGPVPFGDLTSGMFTVLILVWLLLSVSMIAAGFNRRCSGHLDLSLPLEPRRLWIGHILAVILPASAVLVLAAGVVIAGNFFAGVRPLMQPGLLAFGIQLGTGFVLGLALLQSPRPPVERIPFTCAYLFLTISTVAGILGLVILLSLLPLICVLVPLGVALFLFARIYCLLPASFSLVPLEPAACGRPGEDRSTGAALEVGAGARQGSFWLLHLTIWRSAIGNWTWLFLIAFGFHGLVLSLSFVADEGRGSAFVYLFFTWSILSCWLLLTIRRLYVLDSFPISRHRIFAVFILSAFLTVAAGYGLGLGIGVSASDYPPQVELEVTDCCCCVRVPHEYREISWDGTVPASVAPWGEKVVPARLRLFKGGHACSYSPFETSPDSSVDFVAWQVSRAVEAVYGESIAAGVIRDRYLESGPEGKTRPGERGFRLLEDFQDLQSGAGTRTIPAVFLIVAFSWLIFGALIYRAQRNGTYGTGWWFLAISVFLAVLVVGVGALAADSVELIELVAFADFFAVLLRHLYDVVPGGGFAVWAGSAALVAGGYFLASKQFAAVEAPVEWNRNKYSRNNYS